MPAAAIPVPHSSFRLEIMAFHPWPDRFRRQYRKSPKLLAGLRFSATPNWRRTVFSPDLGCMVLADANPGGLE
jgi:hypothetical protein